MTSKKIDVEQFLNMAESYPVVDVRSPSEFEKGHIPGAINIPLFNDKERELVGTKYKRAGKVPAVILGIKYAGPDMSTKLERAIKISKKGKLLVHCWRGGMRSEAMAWLFSLGDIETKILEGGYKSYRHFLLHSLSEKRNLIVLGGMTGSSKTHILQYLKQIGEQVLDLEGFANHKGSAFGYLGQEPQPTTEHFANLLFDEWRKMDKKLPIWVEDESKNIGTVFIPDGLYDNMQNTPAIIVRMSLKTRLPRLMKEYSTYPKEKLKESILKISKRLGGDNTINAINAVEAGDFALAIEITLFYYDKAYMFGLAKKENKNIIYFDTDSDEIEANAKKILELSREMNL